MSRTAGPGPTTPPAPPPPRSSEDEMALRFLVGFVIACCAITLVPVCLYLGISHRYLHNRHHQQQVNAVGQALNTFWGMALGTLPATTTVRVGTTELPDATHFARDLRPVLATVTIGQNALVSGAPAALTSITTPDQAYHDVAAQLAYPFWGTDKTTGDYLEGGKFSDQFLADVANDRKGNINLTTSSGTKVTYQSHPQPNNWWLAFIAFVVTGAAFLVADAAGPLEQSPGNGHCLLPFNPFDRSGWRYKWPVFVVTAEIGLLTAVAYGYDGVRSWRVRREVLKANAALSAAHPLPDQLAQAKALLAEAERLPLEHRHLPEVTAAIANAHKLLQVLEHLPRVVAEDESRLAAADIAARAEAISRHPTQFMEQHKADLKAQIDYRRELGAGTADAKPPTPGGPMSDHTNIRKLFSDDSLTVEDILGDQGQDRPE